MYSHPSGSGELGPTVQNLWKDLHLACKKLLACSTWLWVHLATIWHWVLPASVPPSGAPFVLFKLLVFQDLFEKSPEQPGLTLWLTLLWAGCCTRDFLRSPSARVILWSQTEGRVGWQINSPSSSKQWSLAHCLLGTASFLFYSLYSIQCLGEWKFLC